MKLLIEVLAVIGGISVIAMLFVFRSWAVGEHVHLWEVRDKDYKNGIIKLKCCKCGLEDYMPLGDDVT